MLANNRLRRSGAVIWREPINFNINVQYTKLEPMAFYRNGKPKRRDDNTFHFVLMLVSLDLLKKYLFNKSSFSSLVFTHQVL